MRQCELKASMENQMRDFSREGEGLSLGEYQEDFPGEVGA